MSDTFTSIHRLPAGNTQPVHRTDFIADDIYSHRLQIDKATYVGETFQSLVSVATFHDACFLADGTWDYETLDAVVGYLTKIRDHLDAL